MANLLFLSGGVESTCLLEYIDPSTDYAFTVVKKVNNRVAAYHADLDCIEKIVAHYRLKNHIVFEINYNSVEGMVSFGHQRDWLMPAVQVLCSRLPSVDTLLFGWHRDEPIKPKFQNIMDAIAMIYPNVKWAYPYHSLTKGEQWQMIPDEIKKYVISCYDYYDPNHDRENCEKCRERKFWCAE